MWGLVGVLHGTFPWCGTVSPVFSPAVVDFAEFIVAALGSGMSGTLVSVSIAIGIGIGVGIAVGVGICSCTSPTSATTSPASIGASPS